jgi:hypothetical protein
MDASRSSYPAAIAAAAIHAEVRRTIEVVENTRHGSALVFQSGGFQQLGIEISNMLSWLSGACQKQ